MYKNIHLPESLIHVLGQEKREFAVRAKRAEPMMKSIGLIIFGLVWTGFTSILLIVISYPLFTVGEVNFTSNGVETVATLDDMEPLMMPLIIIGLFVVVGIGMLGFGIFSLFKKGGYFVGTPTRLVHYKKGRIRSIDWEQFSGDIELSGNMENGSLVLGMRTGRMVSQKNSSDRYVPDAIHITGIPDVFTVEKICRTRIKENDPTPVNSDTY
jgi:hypothetical protein